MPINSTNWIVNYKLLIYYILQYFPMMQQLIDHQTLVSSIQGGIILALATTFNYLIMGRITGMSGTLSTILTPKINHQFFIKLSVLCGLLFSSGIVHSDEFKIYFNIQAFEDQTVSINSFQYIIAGYFVGLGTRLSNGCTSGHGLCGLPRLSLRSIMAVIIFLPVAIATSTFQLKNYLPFYTYQDFTLSNQKTAELLVKISVIIPIIIMVIFSKYTKSNNHNQFFRCLHYFISFLTGITFGFGLMISGMTKPSKIEGFLNLQGKWDPSLLFVLFSGVFFNLITFNIIIKIIKKPLLESSLSNPQSNLNIKLFLGAAFFGIGWGLGSMCPGPFMMLLSKFQINLQGVWLLGYFLGLKSATFYETITKKELNPIATMIQ